MIIDGKSIAERLKIALKKRVIELQDKHIQPNLAVVLIGNNPSSLVYIRQKQRVGEELGVKVSIYKEQRTDNIKHKTNKKEWLLALVNRLNSDKTTHGLIIQRPIPVVIDKEELDRLVKPSKDVDSFHPNSPFTPPIALAVLKILDWVYKSTKDTSGVSRSDSREVEESGKRFINWLKKKQILIIGRGETAGKPIAATLHKMGINFEVAHSQTNNLKELCLKADIIISCVGRRSILRSSEGCRNNESTIVRHHMLKKHTTLIGVGLHLEDGKLQTDYNQEEIANSVDYYTPVPGGVGPVNVACLFENLISACSKL